MDPVIEIDSVSKDYRLGTIGYGTLRQDIESWWARLRGLEDPNSLVVGIEKHRIGPGQVLSALSDVSLTVDNGEILGIIGRNGAGKSTLLKILSRITVPTRGVVRMRGRIASLLEVGTGFHPELTGRENVFLNGAILGMSRSEVSRKFDEIVDFSEVEDFIDTPVKRYSSGMYVRLAFAVAAHLDSEILIVDEVLAVGDAAFQKKCLGRMREASGRGRTVLFVSHNMSSIKKLCTRLILLHDGRIVARGAPGEVIESYKNMLAEQSELETESAIVQFPVKPEQDFQFLRMSILDESGQPRNSFTIHESFRLVFEYETRRLIENMMINFTIYRDGEWLLHSADTDLEPSLQTHFPGRYRATITIPALRLPAARYELRCAAGISGGQSTTMDKPDAAIEFRIELGDEESLQLTTFLPGRAGPLLFPADWNTVRLDPDAPFVE
ncbi:MAG: ABC transporter ATP-binding protein [Spirochaetales bacterium]|nr:ABC transporter ATP-binding protein [Spirochaetales bacterium]